MNEGKAEMRVLHLRLGILAVERIKRLRAGMAVRERERHLADGDDREPAGLITGIDVRDISDAVARHVVVVEGFAELLGGEDDRLDRSAGGFLDIRRPLLRRGNEWMSRGHP